LIVLLLAGGLICLLAAIAPQAWATPEQEPLSDTITDFNDNPTPPDCLWQCDGPVEIRSMDAPFEDPSGGPLMDTWVQVYIIENTGWISGTTKLADVVTRHGTVVYVDNGNFDPNPAMIWDEPEPGYYDLWFDVNGNEVFDDGDGILGIEEPEPGDPAVGAGICVVPCRVGGVTVPDRRLGLVALWAAMGALFSALVTVGLFWRRRQH
jgi:hypothetical protein